MFTFDLADELAATGVTATALHSATYMPTKMVPRPVSTLQSGIDATLRLVIDPALDGVTGRYYNGQREARADPQAHDPVARARLRALSEQLTGLLQSSRQLVRTSRDREEKCRCSYYRPEVHDPYELFDLGDFTLEEGQTLRGAKLAYTTHGQLSPAKDNAILITTWYSGTHKIFHDAYIGVEHALNPNKYFIVVINQIGNGLSTSPHNTDGPYAMGRFPHVRIGDDVRAQEQLLREQFGITDSSWSPAGRWEPSRHTV
ncbi:MAG TPA: hypothetical protein VNA67_10665 [Pseudonocardiaceae bacterium]|nr:hypothetical protein [Pseudonocardiaceae bacterium]